MVDPDQFSDDPASCFEHDVPLLHAIDREQLEKLQLHAIRQRYSDLSTTLLPLAQLGEAAGIDAIDGLEDVGKLLFPYSFYKSYDDLSLGNGYHNDLTGWMQKLTTVDLGSMRQRDFATLDLWFDTLEKEAGLIVTHSSGTTGRLSLMARSVAEVENNARYTRLTIPDWSKAGQGANPGFAVIWTTFAEGHSAVARGAHAFQYGYARSPQDFYPTIPGKLSADWHHFMMRVGRAEAAGQPLPHATPYVADRVEEMATNHKAHDEQTAAVLDLLTGKLKGERMLLVGAPFVLLQLAQAGLRRGLEGILAPGSAVMTFGGLKGRPAEERMAETILTFTGVNALTNLFVMTEAGSALLACDQGYFHFYPWTVPYLIDPATGALFPRDGTRTGRLALFDLLAKSYWGGLVTADRVTLDWSPCACGRGSARIHPDIERFDDGGGSLIPACPAGEVATMATMRELGE